MSKKDAKDFYLIRKWRDETKAKIKLARPDLSDDFIEDFLNRKIEERFKDHEVIVHNNHREKQVKTTLLNLIDFIHEAKPILGGNGVMYNDHNHAYSASGKMLDTMLKDRARIKADRQNYDPRSYEFMVRDIGQDNKKRLANSFYGASGAPTSCFYNKYTAASVTGTGQALICTAETSYEQLFANNTKFYDMDECLLFISRIVNKAEYKHIDLLPEIDGIYDKTIAWLLDSFMYRNKVDMNLLEKVVRNLSLEDVHKVYFKNNIEAFFTEIPRIGEILTKIINETTEFRNPNEVPKYIKEDLEELWDLCEEFCAHNYTVRNRIERDKYHKRKVIITQDTDSTMATLLRHVTLLTSRYLKENVAAATDEDITFILVNTLAYLFTRWSRVFLWRYGKDTNIPEEYRTYIKLKNEFFYPKFVATETKKRYLTIMRLQEGKLIDPMKIETHGLDFAKAETSDETKAFFDGIVKNDIMFPEQINVSQIMRKLKNFENTIRESIMAGSTQYLGLKSVKPAAAYDDPMGEQGIKAVNAWNLVYPSMTIQLPDKVFLVKVLGEKQKHFETFKGKIPDEFYNAVIDKIFNSLNPRLAKQGLSVIAIPQNMEKIPDWIITIADLDTIVYDNVSKFNPILVSLGNVPLKTRANTAYMSNVIDL